MCLASTKEDIDDVVNEPLASELQMVSLNVKEMKPSSFIQGLESNAVLNIDWRLPEGKDDVGLAGGVELKVLEGGEVDGVALVLHGLLVVDLCHELALLDV